MITNFELGLEVRIGVKHVDDMDFGKTNAFYYTLLVTALLLREAHMIKYSYFNVVYPVTIQNYPKFRNLHFIIVN